MKGSDYCGSHDEQHLLKFRCSRVTWKGKPCKGGAIAGTDLCLNHTPHRVGVAQVGQGQGIVDIAYREYLKTPQWKIKRGKRLDIDGHACVLCRSTEHLEVHHLSYDRLGHEPLFDLRTLCHDCHEAVTDAERTLGHQEANEVFYRNYRRSHRRKRASSK